MSRRSPGLEGPAPSSRPSSHDVIRASRPAPPADSSSGTETAISARPSSVEITRCTGSSGAAAARCSSSAV